MAALDLSIPSYAGAVHFARQAAFAGGRTEPDRAAGDAVLARLLWHVEASEGGFMGRDDAGVEAHAARLRLSMALVNDAMWTRGAWPVAGAEQVAA